LRPTKHTDKIMAHRSHSGFWKRFLFAFLGRSNGRRFLAGIVRRQTAHLPPLLFPLDTAAVKRVLVILPPEQLSVLHQLKNIHALKTVFRNADMTLLAEASCVELAGIIEDVSIAEYRREEKRLFSASFSVFNRSLKDSADVCCLLTDTEDLPLLYLAGRTVSPVRVGYAAAGEFPFINIHVNPSHERRYLTDRNCAMAEALGAEKTGEIALPVAAPAKAEIDYLMRGISKKGRSHPVGIDAFYFYRAFGAKRAAEIIKAIPPVVKSAVYLYADETPDASEMEWLSRFNLPLMHHLTVSQLRALLFHSELAVTGNTVLFGLAAVLGSKAVGIFHKNDLDRYCLRTGNVRGVAFEKTPDAETVKAIAAAVAELL
jgi:ADP-heptose:LPS heptosyltransferase